VGEWDFTQPFFPATAPPALAITLHGRYTAFGEPSGSALNTWWSSRTVRRQILEVMREFPFLSDAQWDAPERPYRLVIEATHAVRGSKLRTGISRMSHHLIPVTEERAVELEAWVFRGEELLRRYEAIGRYKTRWHLLFLALPWMWGPRVVSRTVQETFRDLLLQIQQDAPALFGTG
jgi:hypothetical protein